MIGRVATLLGESGLLPLLKLIEVGAAPTHPRSRYDALVNAGLAEVVAFEPSEQACERLLHLHPRGWTILPMALGEGGIARLHLCRSPYCTSLLEPDLAMARLFTGLAAALEPRGTTEIETRRLDDVPEAVGASWLALDVQGAEILVLRNGTARLAEALAVRLEVQFIPQYRGAPGIGEIDLFMREHGFVMHTAEDFHSRAFAPVILDGDPNRGLRQLLWADVIYIRDPRRMDLVGTADLLRLAILAESLLGSPDLSHLALETYDLRSGTNLASSLRAALVRTAA